MIEIISAFISGIVSGIVGKMSNRNLREKRKRARVNTKKLTSFEIEYIMNYYDSKLGRFVSEGITIAESGENINVLGSLIDRGILCYYYSDYPKIESYNGSGVIYKLTPGAIKLFNRNHWKKKLINMRKDVALFI